MAVLKIFQTIETAPHLLRSPRVSQGGKFCNVAARPVNKGLGTMGTSLCPQPPCMRAFSSIVHLLRRVVGVVGRLRQCPLPLALASLGFRDLARTKGPGMVVDFYAAAPGCAAGYGLGQGEDAAWDWRGGGVGGYEEGDELIS